MAESVQNKMIKIGKDVELSIKNKVSKYGEEITFYKMFQHDGKTKEEMLGILKEVKKEVEIR